MLGSKMEDSCSCKGEIVETIGIRQSGNDRAKQDYGKIKLIYNNYNKIQNIKCIVFPCSAVRL